MAAAIGPGSMVLVVATPSSNDHPLYPHLHLTVGALYCVEALGQSVEPCPHDGCGIVGIKLKEKVHTFFNGRQVHPLYCPNLFKPLGDGDTSLVKGEDREEAERLGAHIDLCVTRALFLKVRV